MANSEAADGERWVRRRRGLDGERAYESSGRDVSRRRIRVERVVGRSSTLRRMPSSAKMTSASRAPRESTRSTRGSMRRSHHRERSRSRRRSAEKEETTYVYGAPGEKKRSSRIVVTERRLGRDGESSEEEEKRATHSDEVKGRGGGRVIYVSAKDGKVLKTEERRESRTREASERPRHSEESIHRSRAPRSRRHSVSEAPRSPPKRFALLNIR